jgi:TonB family protein
MVRFTVSWPSLLLGALAWAVLTSTPATSQKGAPSRPAANQGQGADFSGRGVTVLPRDHRTEPYELSEIDEQPSLLDRAAVADSIARHYPSKLRRNGVTGMVVLRFVIQPDGTVDPRSIGVEAPAHPGFVTAASSVARGMRFRPAMKDGHPVRTWVTLPIVFQLEEGSRPPEGSDRIPRVDPTAVPQRP